MTFDRPQRDRYDVYDQILAPIVSRPKLVFKRPPRLPDFYQRESTRSSTLSSGPGDSQGEPSPSL